MRVLHLTYKKIRNYSDPDAWLKRINFFVALLEQMAMNVEVKNIHCINYQGVVSRNGVEYHFLKRNILGLWFPFTLHRYVQKLNPEIIIVHGIENPWQVLWLHFKIGRNVPIIIQHHSEKTLHHYKRFLQRQIDRFVAVYFFPSLEQARPWIEDKLIENAAKIHEVMEVPSVFSPVDKKLSRTKTNVKGDRVYLWVGRLESNKDPITLVRAFLQFATKNTDSMLYVIFQSDELIGEVEALFSDAIDVSKRVVLVGKVQHEDLLYWFNSADFIISTSHYEGMGVAVCEAMSCGCIPLLTDIPSFKKMTGNGKCGVLFKAGDVSDLTATLYKSLSLDIEREKEKTLATYRELLSAEAISSRMTAVCRHLVSLQQDSIDKAT